MDEITYENLIKSAIENVNDTTGKKPKKVIMSAKTFELFGITKKEFKKKYGIAVEIEPMIRDYEIQIPCDDERYYKRTYVDCLDKLYLHLGEINEAMGKLVNVVLKEIGFFWLMDKIFKNKRR